MTDVDEPHGSPGDQVAVRRMHARALRDAGVDPYPVGVAVADQLAEVRAEWDDKLEAGEESEHVVSVAGRLVTRRSFGKLEFYVLREGDTDLQVMVTAKVLDHAAAALLEHVDVGDWLAVTGPLIRTKKGELSVKATDVRLLAKSLRPLPDKWHGLTDTDTRYRQRYVDLAVNADARRVMTVRSRAVQALRAELVERGFVEVETPLLHPIPGGAVAKPFVTHHEALHLDLYLRIAPELYLKRLVVGGLTKVFELGRVFRNEGLSTRHNPEFTLLETYEAYTDHEGVMALTEALLKRAARDATGGLELTYDGRGVSLHGIWPRRPLLELVRDTTGHSELSYDSDLDELRALCAEHGVPIQPGWGAGKLVVELYERLVEPGLWEPTFVTEHPLETSPLARRHRERPHVAERFELIVTGRELANGFSELADPDDQRARFEAQAAAREAGDAEAMVVDTDYLRALEYGLPPTGGLGVGVDRLVMLLADVQTIREVILFPTLRPEA